MAKVIEDTEYTNLTRDVNTITTEQKKGYNTKTRIGKMFQDIIEYLHNRNIEGGGGGISDLTGYSWWGRSFTNEEKAITGNLSGNIDYIEFSNGVRVGIDSASNTLKVYNKDGSTANIYATGGVSALGMSSSGGGGGGGTDLGTFLAKLNSDNPSLSQGYLYYSGGNNGTFYMTAGGGGSGLTPGNLAAALDGVTAPTGGTTGYLYFNGSNYSWGNPGGSSNLPIASNDTLGCVKVGNTLTIDNGVLNVSQMNIPKASSSVLGGVIVESGSGLSVDNYGKLSLDSNNITASKLGTRTVGSSTQPIYLNGGSPTLCNQYAGGTAVTLNGGSKAGGTASFWAPTSGGTQDYVLKSNGSGAPVWAKQSSLTVGKAAEADRLSDNGTRTVWGQTYWQNGGPKNVTGDMTKVGSITMSGYIFMNNGTGISMKDTKDITRTMIGFNGGNAFYLGYGARLANYQTDIQGGTITFATNNGVTGNNDSRLDVAEFTSTGQLHLKQYDDYTKGLRIGNAVLYYDSDNKALCIQNSDGTPANFYATGGVSALGMSAGTSSTDSMTFNHLTVNNMLYVGSSSNYLYKNNRGLVITSELITLDGYVFCEDRLEVNGSLTAPQLKLDDTHYFKLDSNGVLKFKSGTTEKTVSLV